jgi:hypothetical protein
VLFALVPLTILSISDLRKSLADPLGVLISNDPSTFAGSCSLSRVSSSDG